MDCSNGDWTAISASWKNSPHSSPGWEEYGNYTQPGVHPYHESSLPAEDSSVRPRGILTVDADLQYSFHSEPSSTAPPYQRRRPVGHPSPTPHHHVLTRITSCPRASGTPSGASISQPSFCVPPHIPAWPPTPFRYSPYDLRLAMSLASPERLDIQYRGLALETTSSHHIPFLRFAKTDFPTSHRLCALREHLCPPGFVLAAANHFSVPKIENDT
ncbi:hypothetical protein EDB87DRAFT_1689307 [Lactarius vividus]|nr:hypothetical protein EDB87DRAFT_1689307 [Lactarius vividus]